MMPSRKKTSLALSVFICLLGSFLIYYSTTYGPWVGSDSAGYYEVGRNLAAGHGLVVIRASGLVVPLYLRPPLFPFVLGIAQSMGFEMLEFNRFLNIILFGVFLFILGRGTNIPGQSYVYPVSFMVLIIASSTFIQVFTGAMSEPIFFTLGTLSLALLLSYFHSRNHWFLGFSAILAGLTFLDRFIGAAFIVVGAIMIMWQDQWKIKRVWRDLLLFTGVGLVPFLVWLIGLFKTGYTPGVYQFGKEDIWHILEPFRVSLVEHVWKWLPGLSILGNLHYRTKLLILFLLMISLLFVVYQSMRKATSDGMSNLVKMGSFSFGIWSLLFVISIIILAFSYVFVESPKPALDDRVLSPLQLFFWGMLLSGLFSFHLLNRRRNFPWILICVFVLSTAAFNIPDTAAVVSEFHERGFALTNIRWRSSGVIRELNDLPESIPIVTNESAAILFYTERPAYEIPELVEGIPVKSFQTFGDNPSNVAERVFREEGAVLVLFDTIYWQFWPLYGQETQHRLDEFISGLFVYYDGWDGSIYLYKPPEPE
jgi:hypothetical protein